MLRKNQRLNVQCFVRNCFPSFPSERTEPELLYVARTSPAASAYPRIMHAHPDALELVLITSGEGDYFIHDRLQHVRAGDLLVYNAGVVHDEWAGLGAQIGSCCMAVRGLHLPGLRENALIPDIWPRVFPCGDEFEDLQLILEMMYLQLSQARRRAASICSNLMHVVLEKALAIVEQPRTGCAAAPLPSQAEILSLQIKNYIDAHFCEPISLQSLSDALNFSPYYLSHTFKQVSGYSPIQYLSRRRIGEAQTLLISTDLSVNDISGMVGYDTQSYFNLQFTKHIGMPPMRFRRSFVVEGAGPEDAAVHRRPAYSAAVGYA